MDNNFKISFKHSFSELYTVDNYIIEYRNIYVANHACNIMRDPLVLSFRKL